MHLLPEVHLRGAQSRTVAQQEPAVAHLAIPGPQRCLRPLFPRRLRKTLRLPLRSMERTGWTPMAPHWTGRAGGATSSGFWEEPKKPCEKESSGLLSW